MWIYTKAGLSSVHYHTHSKFLSSGAGHSGPHLHPTASQTAIRLSAGNPRIKEEKLPHVKMACQRTECCWHKNGWRGLLHALWSIISGRWGKQNQKLNVFPQPPPVNQRLGQETFTKFCVPKHTLPYIKWINSVFRKHFNTLAQSSRSDWSPSDFHISSDQVRFYFMFIWPTLSSFY